MFIGELLNFVFLFSAKSLINWFENGGLENHECYWICLIITISVIIRTFCVQHALVKVCGISVDALCAVFGIYFEKLKSIPLKTKSKLDLSKILNSMSSDINKLYATISYIRNFFITPSIIVIMLYFLYKEIGYLAFLGFIILGICCFLQFLIGRRIVFFTEKKLRIADRRNDLISNMISGIKVIKFNAWEEIVYKQINKTREEETKKSFLITFSFAVLNGFSFFIPLLCSMISIVLYMKTVPEDEFNIGSIFFIIFIFNLLQENLIKFFFLFSQTYQTLVVVNRVGETLLFPKQEPNEDININDEELTKGECIIKDGDFSYGSKQPNNIIQTINETHKASSISNVLSDINLSIKDGEFVAIIGEIGCGKSSLLKAICKSLFIEKGFVKKNGKIGYIPQKAFLLNDTIRNNILFGKSFDLNRYVKILKACQLKYDLEVLPAGEYTEIGERGINLSGGQKQRINIARTIYADCDIYLIDVSLSALDAYVGQKVFTDVFKGFIGNKTKIMVTHALHYLSDVDRIIFIKDGVINDEGTLQQLKNNVDFNNFVQQIKDKKSKKQKKSSKHPLHDSFDSVDNNSKDKDNEEGKLIVKEKRFTGGLDSNVIYNYIFKSGRLLFFTNIFVFFCMISLKFIADYWVSAWGRHYFNLSTNEYIYVCICIVLGMFLLIFISPFVWAKNVSKNSFYIFDELIKKILKKKMIFFDTTPIGQILNLSSVDIDILDVFLPNRMAYVFSIAFFIGFTFILLIVGNFFLIFLFLIMIYLFSHFIKMYLKTIIELTRLQQNANSPILSTLTELFNGLIVFRSLNKIDFIYSKFTDKVNLLINPMYTLLIVIRYVSLIVDIGLAIFMGISLSILVTGKIQQWDFVLGNQDVLSVTISMFLYLPVSLAGFFFFFCRRFC